MAGLVGPADDCFSNAEAYVKLCQKTSEWSHKSLILWNFVILIFVGMRRYGSSEQITTAG